MSSPLVVFVGGVVRTNKVFENLDTACRFILAVSAVTFSPAVVAHGFRQRYDLPIPLGLWVIGAGATIVLSFVIVGLVDHGRRAATPYARINLLRVGLMRGLAHWLPLGAARLLAVVFLVATVLAGFVGDQDPFANLAPVMVWVVWWVGVAFVCALIGDLWALINPFRTIFSWAERIFYCLAKSGQLSLARPYPRKLAMWPAVAGLLIFFWAELIWPDGTVPQLLAFAIVIYALVTWVGMFVYGRDVWLQNADTFSIVFGIMARFAPLELRVANDKALIHSCASPVCRGKTQECVNGYHCLIRAAPDRWEWNLRPPALGLLNDQRVTFSMMVLVIVLLATVSFDGLLETRLWTHVLDRTLTGEIRSVGSVALVLFSGGFLLIYLFFCALMRQFAKRYGDSSQVDQLKTTLELASLFVLTLVPIAIAYHLAHYVSFLLITGQYAIPLISDPLGHSWDLFGTAHYQVDTDLVSARVAWYLAVSFVVLGHVYAVYLAHVVAGRIFGSGRAAFLSQIPMVLLMVLYTMASLWILAQPMVT